MKELLVIRVRIKSFVKKPTNGGTPAIEKIKIVIVVTKKLLKLKPVNDCRVLSEVVIVLKSVQKSATKDMLYTNMYVKSNVLLSVNRL